MKKRINLQFIEGRLYLNSIVDLEQLRIRFKKVEFVIDTGSPESFFSQADAKKLMIPVKGRKEIDQITFGGSVYKLLKLPLTKLYVLNDQKKREVFTTEINVLDTTKTSPQKIVAAETLPSIIGMDFLEENNLSLHFYPKEKLAYLEFEN